MRTITRFLTVCLVAMVAVGPTPVAAAHCEDLHVETYEVKMRALRDVYDVGDQARVRVLVTRIDTGEPASFIDVGIGGTTDEDQWDFDIEATDRRGRAVMELSLKKMPPGWMTLYGYAWRETVDTYCAGVTEYGQKMKRRAFRVRN